MLELVKSNEVENKPTNVEEAIKAGWRTAKEIYECSGVCRDTFNVFLSAVRKATSEKPNSRCVSTPTANLVIKLGSAHKAYYHPKVEEAFQYWLMKNQANIGNSSQIIKQAVRNSVDNNEYKYSKEDICSICNVDEKTFRRFFEEVRLDSTVQSGIITLAHNKKMYA